MNDWNSCGRKLRLLVFGDIVGSGGIVRVRCGRGIRKNMDPIWLAKMSTQKVCRGVVEGLGREEEGVVWREIVLLGGRQ